MSVTAIAGVLHLTTDIKIVSITANTMIVAYDTLIGNRPKTFGNQVLLWENTHDLFWEEPPVQIQSIPNDKQTGQLIFTGIEAQHSYYVGYSIGSYGNAQKQAFGNVCATSVLPAKGTLADVIHSVGSIEIINVNATSIFFECVGFPDHINFKTNGAWVGIWEGFPSFYTRPIARVQFMNNHNGVLTDMNIKKGYTYTVALFMSGYSVIGNSNQETMATSTTFRC